MVSEEILSALACSVLESGLDDWVPLVEVNSNALQLGFGDAAERRAQITATLQDLERRGLIGLGEAGPAGFAADRGAVVRLPTILEGDDWEYSVWSSNTDRGDALAASRPFGFEREVDGDEIDAIDARLRSRGWSAPIAKMAMTWAELGREVNSFRGEVEDYTNDLTVRDGLEEVRGEALGSLRSRLDRWLTHADWHFREATTGDERKLLGRFYSIQEEDGWWWRRIPKGGQLRRALER